MKKLFFTLVILVVLIGGVALVAFSQLDTIVKKGVEKQGPAALKIPVEIQSVKISPLSGSVHLAGLNFGQPKGFGEGTMASLGTFDMVVEPKSLFTNHIIIDHIDVVEPLLDVRVNDRGHTNFKAFQNGLDLPEGASGGISGSDAGAGPSEITLTIRKLMVRAPKLSIRSEAMMDIDKDVKLADFALTDIGTDEVGLSPREVARHIMDALQPQITKALVAAGAGDKIQDLTEKARGKLESQIGNVLGKLKEKEEKTDQPNN